MLAACEKVGLLRCAATIKKGGPKALYTGCISSSELCSRNDVYRVGGKGSAAQRHATAVNYKLFQTSQFFTEQSSEIMQWNPNQHRCSAGRRPKNTRSKELPMAQLHSLHCQTCTIRVFTCLLCSIVKQSIPDLHTFNINYHRKWND